MQVWALLLALLAPLSTMWRLPATGLPPPKVAVFELARPAPAVPAIKARAAFVLDLDAGTTLFQLDPHGRHAPASLTKVVTALVALDHLRLDQVVTVPASINQLPWDSTRMGLRVGEQVAVRELMEGLFLNSGNDAAITLSEAAMPRATFVGLMNAKVAALGMADTHFVNPIGLDDPGHYTSAADLAEAAIELTSRYPMVAAMAATPSLTLPATASHHALPALQPQSIDSNLSRRDRPQDRVDRSGRRMPDRDRDPWRTPSAGGGPGIAAHFRRSRRVTRLWIRELGGVIRSTSLRWRVCWPSSTRATGRWAWPGRRPRSPSASC